MLEDCMLQFILYNKLAYCFRFLKDIASFRKHEFQKSRDELETYKTHLKVWMYPCIIEWNNVYSWRVWRIFVLFSQWNTKRAKKYLALLYGIDQQHTMEGSRTRIYNWQLNHTAECVYIAYTRLLCVLWRLLSWSVWLQTTLKETVHLPVDCRLDKTRRCIVSILKQCLLMLLGRASWTHFVRK